jgi:hypothetical protein
MKSNTKICPECNGNGFVDVTIFDTLAAGLPNHPREVRQCENCNSSGEVRDD